MQISVPPNVPGGAAGKKLLSRMHGANALAGLDGVDRLYKLSNPRRAKTRLAGMGDWFDDLWDTQGSTPASPAANPNMVDLSAYMNEFGFNPGSSPPAYSSAATPNNPPPSSGTPWGNLWASVISGWSTTGQQILKQENLPRGVYMQTGPNGTVYYTQPTGNPQNILSAAAGTVSANVGSGSMTPIMLAGLGVLAVFVVMQMGKR